MNYSKLLILLLLISITVEAAYLRSVRVSTQYSEIESQQALKQLNSFIKLNKNLLGLQKKWDFQARSQVSGKYWLNVIEPIENKQVLKEVLKTIRTKYPDAYSKRIKKAVKVVEEKKLPPISVVNIPKVEEVEIVSVVQTVKVSDAPIVEPIADDKEVTEVEKVIEIDPVVVELEKIKKTTQVIKEKVIIKKVLKEVEEKSENINIKKQKAITLDNDLSFFTWKIAFFIMLFFFVLAVLFLLISKKKNRKIRKKEKIVKMQSEEKDIHYSSQIKNNENFLSEAQTSMSSVIQYSNLLLEFDLSVIQKDYVQRIKNSSASLLNVVNNTSDISKIQVGELEMNMIDFNIRNMIGDVSNIISLEAKQNHVNLNIEIPEDIPHSVVGDSRHLKQVLISLLTDSVKYTREGDVTLTLKKVYSYSHAITLSFIVSDTGIGMSPEQVNSIMHASNNGTSTNLSVSRQLIQRMNGDMKIYSTLGVGSTFTFNIKFDLQ